MNGDVTFSAVVLIGFLSLLGSLSLGLGFLSLLSLFLCGSGSRLIGGNGPLGKLDTDLVSTGFQNELLVLDADDSTNNTTNGGDLIAGLNRRTQLLCFLLALVLRTDQHKVENTYHQN